MNSSTEEIASSKPGLREQVELAVFVLDLFNEDAMSAAAQMSLKIPEVLQALQIAQKARMHLLLVAMTRGESNVSCMPVIDFAHLPQALQALCELINAKDHTVSWVMIPESMYDVVTPDIEKISQLWETRTQGVID